MLQLPEVTRSILPMLQYARPHRSQMEFDFVRRFIVPLDVMFDKFGNGIKRIGTAPILWSCHTDTVHSRPSKYPVGVSNGFVFLPPDSGQKCLGADDAAGVWLMSRMIEASVPGLYVFHAGEERGGLGSQYIAEKTPKLLEGIRFAVALDRKGKTSVITHQMGRRCCSDAFAASLVPLLPPGYEGDRTGLFTDTAHYTDLVGECTNLSVGYDKAHSDGEFLDLAFLASLSDYLQHFDVGTLIAARGPGEPDEDADLRTLCQEYPGLIAEILKHFKISSATIRELILTK